MKRRKGFGTININGKKFLFNWAEHYDDVVLVMYNEQDVKIEIPSRIWDLYPDSEEYTSGLKMVCGSKSPTWHGKHKKGPEWAGYGKREAREMYFKYVRHLEEAMRYAV